MDNKIYLRNKYVKKIQMKLLDIQKGIENIDEFDKALVNQSGGADIRINLQGLVNSLRDNPEQQRLIQNFNTAVNTKKTQIENSIVRLQQLLDEISRRVTQRNVNIDELTQRVRNEIPNLEIEPDNLPPGPVQGDGAGDGADAGAAQDDPGAAQDDPGAGAGQARGQQPAQARRQPPAQARRQPPAQAIRQPPAQARRQPPAQGQRGRAPENGTPRRGR